MFGVIGSIGMASRSSFSKLILLRRTLSRVLKPELFPSSFSTHKSFLSAFSPRLLEFSSSSSNYHPSNWTSRNLCSGSSTSSVDEESQGPASIDYRSLLQEDEYHKLAHSTIHDLLEKLEEYGDSVDVDGYDVDYGNEVLTLKLGSLGTYVINKQTPNRQIWMSSPVSGPSRFDYDQNVQAWIYRRTKAELTKVLETELEQLCGKPITLS